MPTSRSNRPTVLVTIGDPAGIGPEVTLKALASHQVSRLADFFVIGDRFVIDRIKSDMGLKLNVPLLDLSNVPKANFPYGKAKPRLAKASIEYVDKALELLKDKKADALVTAPVNKASVNAARISNFKGHTEYLANKTGTSDYAMMFVGKDLKVVLATRHISLKDVFRHLSIGAVYKAIRLTHKYLKRYFGIKYPKIGVASLNPHAGEDGLFGNEERKIIIPAIDKAQRDTKGISGPISPDVIFYEAFHKKFDAVISMYHDQGLAPFKLIYFKDGVNLTLGLPFVRTSPDHGTAYPIAGRGIADPASMIEAIALACRLSSRSRSRKR